MAHTRHKVFLPEFLLNTLFVSILSAIILYFFAQSHILATKGKMYQQASAACSSVAKVYQEHQGSLDDIAQEYENTIYINQQLLIYLDKKYNHCTKEEAAYYLLVEQADSHIPSVDIRFYEVDKDVVYSIQAYYYGGLTPNYLQEVGPL